MKNLILNPKSILLLLLFSLLSFNCIQSQSEWAPIGATWDYGFYYTNYPERLHWVHYKVEKDTMLSGQACRKVNSTTTEYDGDVYSFDIYTYAEDEKVYMYFQDISEEFILMYDFGQEIGDTLTIPLPFDQDTVRMKVDSISTVVTADNDILKQLHYSAASFSCPIYDRVISGIGGMQRLFPDFCFPVIYASHSEFRCYEDAEIAYSVTDDCDFYGEPNATYEPLALQAQLFPNPAQHFIQLDWNNNIDLLNYTIVNLHGQQITKGTISKNSKQLNVAQFPIGLYFLNVMDADKRQKTFRFIKQ